MVELIHHYANLPFIEWLAVITSLLYVVLAAKNNILCWPAALISTLLYTAIFYESYLWSDSLLQVYYAIMAIYGWLCWRKPNQGEQIDLLDSSLAITKLPLKLHVIAITGLTLTSIGLGWLMSHTSAHFPYLDAGTTVFSLFATYLVTQKVLENWLYWIVIDFVSIYLYLEKGLYPTVLLFTLFVIFAFYGYIAWQKLASEQGAVTIETA